MACEGECDKSFCINCNDSAKCENKIGTLAPEVITIGTPPGIGIRTDMPVKVISDGANAVHINTQAGISVDNIRLEIYRNRSDMEAQITLKDTGEVVDRIPVQWKARKNKLDYLSVSKMSAYEQCPACFYQQYMSDETTDDDGSNYYTKFGSILHEVVELAFKYWRDSGILVDPMNIYKDVWQRHDLTGFDAYEDGKRLVTSYFKRNPVMSRPDDPLFIEHEWRGELGGTVFGLVLDYAGVFRDIPNIGLLKDYKTNRMPYTPADLQGSIQLRIYQLVLRRYLAPQIERWISGYELFYHEWQQCPEWTTDELLSAEEYVASMWRQISSDNTWEEKLNPYCGYRKCRLTCKTYRKFIENPGMFIDTVIIPEITDIREIDRQREVLLSYEKIAKTRKDDCQNMLKIAIEEAMKTGNRVVVDGKELSLYSNQTQSYKYIDTRNILQMNGKINLLDDCVSINKQGLDRKLDAFPGIKSQIQSCMSTNYAQPYIVKRRL